MELISIGFLIGVVFSLIVFGTGFLFGYKKAVKDAQIHTDTTDSEG